MVPWEECIKDAKDKKDALYEELMNEYTEMGGRQSVLTFYSSLWWIH